MTRASTRTRLRVIKSPAIEAAVARLKAVVTELDALPSDWRGDPPEAFDGTEAAFDRLSADLEAAEAELTTLMEEAELSAMFVGGDLWFAPGFAFAISAEVCPNDVFGCPAGRVAVVK